MHKGEAEMGSSDNQIFTRVFVDPEAIARIARIAANQGRTKQRQMGIILENIARLHRENPKQLEALRLLDPPLAAVA